MVLSCIPRCPSDSSKPSLKPTLEQEVLQYLNLVYVLLQHVLERAVKPESFSSVMIMLRMLGMFASKADLLQANKVRTRLVASVTRA